MVQFVEGENGLKKKDCFLVEPKLFVNILILKLIFF